MSNFKVNFKKDLEKVINDGLKDIARDKQRQLDRLGAELRGRPLEEAKRRLKQVWEHDGGRLTDPKLTEYAQLLVDGGQITFKPQPFRMR